VAKQLQLVSPESFYGNEDPSDTSLILNQQYEL